MDPSSASSAAIIKVIQVAADVAQQPRLRATAAQLIPSCGMAIEEVFALSGPRATGGQDCNVAEYSESGRSTAPASTTGAAKDEGLSATSTRHAIRRLE